MLSKYKIGEHIPRLNNSIDKELLKVHRSYLPILDTILDKEWLKALSHITGGGIIENTHRVIADNQDIKVNWDSWEWPEIFKIIQEDGNISTEDMIRPFNLGIGMILIIDKNYIGELKNHLDTFDENYIIMGEVIDR